MNYAEIQRATSLDNLADALDVLRDMLESDPGYPVPDKITIEHDIDLGPTDEPVESWITTIHLDEGGARRIERLLGSPNLRVEEDHQILLTWRDDPVTWRAVIYRKDGVK